MARRNEIDAKIMMDEFRRVQESPSLSGYLALRSKYQSGDLATDHLLIFETYFSIESELNAIGLDLMTMAGVFDGDDKDIDAMALAVMRALVARHEIEASGETHVQRRQRGIQDSLVNYLIMIGLQACNANDICVPSSLVFLITERLGGFTPAHHVKFKISEKKKTAIWMAAQLYGDGEAISVRRIAREMNVEPSTVSRWFKPGELEKEAATVRGWFQNPEFSSRKFNRLSFKGKPKV
jgi:hypothetical protein